MAEIYCRLDVCSECRRLTYKPMQSGPNRNAHIRHPGRWLHGGNMGHFFSWIEQRYIYGACSECQINLRTYSDMATCELCGKLGTKRFITYRSDVVYWNIDRQSDDWWGEKPKATLCCGCWNKAKAVVRKEEIYLETKHLITKLKGAINRCQKSKRLATCADSLQVQSTQ